MKKPIKKCKHSWEIREIDRNAGRMADQNYRLCGVCRKCLKLKWIKDD